jgi:cytochrome c biogenesis protein
MMTSSKPTKGIIPGLIDGFASVKLALVLLIILAVTSILGTILPQGQPLEFYGQAYTPFSAKVIGVFQLYDMYHSWWFQWLLLLLALNLIVCSLKRFPTTWKVIKSRPRSVSDHFFDTLPFYQRFSWKKDFNESKNRVQSFLGKRFGKPVSLAPPEGEAYYWEKGRTSRLGVYLVHLSILIIFLGAIVGSLFGFKGFLELKEGESKDSISITGSSAIKKLGFSVQLDRFAIAFYPNGMPREYRSDLSVWEGGREREKAVVRVNEPFDYKGITFYQSSWDRYPVSVRLLLKKEGRESTLRVAMNQKAAISGTPFSVQAAGYVDNLANLGPALGIILFENGQEINHGWILADHPDFHGNQLGGWLFRVEELNTGYVSGLQVNRDPGVWFIWIGSSLMLIGFIVTFYFSHQQVWVWLREKKEAKGLVRTEIMIGGTAHKNKGAFSRILGQHIEKMRRS